MQITITHDESTIDPSAIYTPKEFTAVRESLEREYTKELLKRFPDAMVYFESGSGYGSGLKVAGDDDEYTAVHQILEDVWETGNFWL